MGMIDLSKLKPCTGSIYPEPYASEMAGRSSLRLGDAGMGGVGLLLKTDAEGPRPLAKVVLEL